MPVEDLSRFKSDKTPVLIEERYELDTPLDPKSANDYKKDFFPGSEIQADDYHLFVLVHGF